jgi:hypothetical protein
MEVVVVEEPSDVREGDAVEGIYTYILICKHMYIFICIHIYVCIYLYVYICGGG